MDERDLIVTPIVILIVYALAYRIRPRVTDDVTRRYFIPALTVKIVGAITVGLIYYYYYGGGDTFSYHMFGSRFVWEAFMDSPAIGFKILFSDGHDMAGIYKYASKIFFFNDPSSYNVVRIAAFFDLFTFSTYSSTAILFAVFCFVGMWLFFQTFYRKYPEIHLWLAIASFFIPSVFFWGSGLLKDTITLGCMGIAIYAVSNIFINRNSTFGNWTLLIGSLTGMYSIKLYILLTFIPAVIIWIFMTHMHLLKSNLLKIMLFPFVIVIAGLLSYFAAFKASEGDDKYSFDKIAQTAQITAYDIRYYTGKNAGSGYELGELDGTFGSMIALAPQAINVSLFRPYLWEVSNPLMLLSSLESLAFLFLTIFVLFKYNIKLFSRVLQPDIFFALTFAVSFAFAVGVSTFNFGTLVRYKIPLLPLYSLSLALILNYANNERKLEVFELTE